MIKKVLAVVLVAVSVILPCGARAASTDQFEGHWELDTTRTVIFASDGGTYIHPAQQEIGTVICLDEYVPIKDGYKCNVVIRYICVMKNICLQNNLIVGIILLNNTTMPIFSHFTNS